PKEPPCNATLQFRLHRFLVRTAWPRLVPHSAELLPTRRHCPCGTPRSTTRYHVAVEIVIRSHNGAIEIAVAYQVARQHGLFRLQRLGHWQLCRLRKTDPMDRGRLQYQKPMGSSSSVLSAAALSSNAPVLCGRIALQLSAPTPASLAALTKLFPGPVQPRDAELALYQALVAHQRGE
ncbi:unnamed protein product, partial [Durusdinium trenchii]